MVRLIIACTHFQLYGPSWNPSIPRFAANLSQEPLEPIKTETAGILQGDSPNPTCQQVAEEIPSVQFDWNSSGLTNPLDCEFLNFFVISNNCYHYS